MYHYIYILAFVASIMFTNPVYAYYNLYPISSFPIDVAEHPRADDFIFNRGLDLQFNDSEPTILNVYTRFINVEPGQEGVRYYPDFYNQSQVEKINIHTLEPTVEMLPDYATAGYLESTTFAVTVNDLMFTLESAYLETQSRDTTNSWSDTRTLVRAKLSPNGALIAGELNNTRVSVPISGGGAHLRIMDFMIPGVWHAQTGTLLYPENFNDVISLWRTNYSVEIGFSSDSRYYWLRGLDHKVFLFDLEKWVTVNAERDVCFSDDSRYFITTRYGDDLYLLDAKSNTELLSYNTPSPMVSATFSQDNSNVYILCEDDVVYVFDQEMITTISGWELY